MCSVCGCGVGGNAVTLVHAHDDAPTHRGHAAHDHRHDHHDHHDHGHRHHDHDHHHHEEAREARIVRVERDILEKNDRFAATNRSRFVESRTLVLNLVCSPGAGKTSLLVRTLQDLRKAHALAVIEGDQQTRLDADRIEATGVPAVQINTGKMCHLDAKMIAEALAEVPPPPGGVMFVENVGNLVCPAGFDLGEAAKVVLVAVTEGEDKPLKYPDMFHAAGLVLVTKTDLLPHLDFDVDLLETNARKVNPRAEVLRVSTRTGSGLGAWYAWIEAHRPNLVTA